MFDGKDFFTVFDFVKAHHNFADPDWDGEPLLAEESCNRCGESPCSCETSSPQPCAICNNSPCSCTTDPKPCADCDQIPCICQKKIEIKLNDGKVRQIQHISSVMYWSTEGKPITAKEFIERMFDDLPQFFENEDQLREIWGNPDTREKLLNDLTESGYDAEKLESMKALIDAQDSDVYDVLAHVAYASETRSRSERVNQAKPAIIKAFSDYKQQEFIEFILEKYIADGVQELAAKKMRSLVELKYNTISDAAVEFGSATVIRDTFIGFQKHLYEL
jgi:type I restriction enzyme R subunit